jgi:hypothetical protein
MKSKVESQEGTVARRFFELVFLFCRMTEAKLRDSGTAKGGDAELARWFLASPKNSSEKVYFLPARTEKVRSGGLLRFTRTLLFDK